MPHRVAPEAELDNIWYYVAKESGSIEIADRLIDSITERFYPLACHPHIGRHRDRPILNSPYGYPAPRRKTMVIWECCRQLTSSAHPSPTLGQRLS